MPWERRAAERRKTDRRKKSIPWPTHEERRKGPVRKNATRRTHPPGERGLPPKA
jgi:hypothetical protein